MKKHEQRGIHFLHGYCEPIDVDEIVVWRVPAFTAPSRFFTVMARGKFGGVNGLRIAAW